MGTVAPAPMPSSSQTVIRVVAWLGLLLGAALSVAKAWVWSGGSLNSEAFGYAMGGELGPLLLAYLIAGRKSVRNFNRFSACFFGLCCFFFVLEFSNRPLDAKSEVKRLAREAAGTARVQSGSTGLQDLERAVMGSMLEYRKQHDAEVERHDLRGLYSAQSFSSKRAMQDMLASVQAIVSADEELSRKIDSWPEVVKQQVTKAPISQRDKDAFLRGVTRTFASSEVLNVHNQTMEREREWAKATTNLYTFALENARSLSVVNSKLIIHNDEKRARFNDYLRNSQSLRRELQSANAQLRQAQEKVEGQTGVTKQDLGLH